jgi:hypothetical protein
MISKFEKYSVAKIWLFSLIAYLGGSLVITLIDFFGEWWFKIAWPHGSDLFPNMILGYPLLSIQLLAVYFLISAGAKTYTAYRGIKGALLSLTLVLLTGVISLSAFIFGAYWYQFELMGRSM